MSRVCPTREAASRYLDGTMTAPEIAAKTGLPASAIYALIRRNGWREKVKPIYRQRTKPVEINLPPHIQAWVEQQCPVGLRVDEMIAAIVTDAYHEEKK